MDARARWRDDARTEEAQVTMSAWTDLKDWFYIVYWSLRGHEKEAVYITMYRKARRDGLTHEEAVSIAVAYVRGLPK